MDKALAVLVGPVDTVRRLQAVAAVVVVAAQAGKLHRVCTRSAEMVVHMVGAAEPEDRGCVVGRG